MLRSGEARLLSAEMRGDEAEWHRLRDVVRAEGGWAEVAPAAFALAAQRYFRQYPDPRWVAVFIRRVVERGSGLTEFSPRDVEAMIRGVTGEEHLVASVEPAAAGPIMYAMVFASVDELGLDD